MAGSKKPSNASPDFSALWNEDDTERFTNETYYHLLMEQYKVYVKISDNISARRTMINTFFLTLHAIIIGVIGLSLSRQPSVPNLFLLLVTLVGLLVLCFAWWKLSKYYRRVSRVKKQVISELEKRLPSNASLATERFFLDNRKNPLCSIETTMPIAFSLLYILAYSYVVYFSLTHV